MKRLFATAAATVLMAGTAQADAFTDSVVSQYQDMGFTFVEVQGGPTQVKVEAIKGDQKLEVIYDRATGSILKQEQERAEADERNRTGVQVRERGRDFVSGSGGVAGGPTSTDIGAANDVVASLRDQGFTFFEVKNGPTQVKIEAVRGNEKVELIIDRATGAILKQETEAAGDDAGRTGMEIDTRDRDFLRDGDDDDDDDDDDRSGRHGGDDDDDDDDDDDHDDDDDSGHGGDDDDDDDDNSGSDDD